MPCDLTKAASMTPAGATAAIGQHLISTNNSSFSLVQQFNNQNISMPHHFSSISSSGKNITLCSHFMRDDNFPR